MNFDDEFSDFLEGTVGWAAARFGSVNL